jgi:hypothetical protein
LSNRRKPVTLFEKNLSGFLINHFAPRVGLSRVVASYLFKQQQGFASNTTRVLDFHVSPADAGSRACGHTRYWGNAGWHPLFPWSSGRHMANVERRRNWAFRRRRGAHRLDMAVRSFDQIAQRASFSILPQSFTST